MTMCEMDQSESSILQCAFCSFFQCLVHCSSVTSSIVIPLFVTMGRKRKEVSDDVREMLCTMYNNGNTASKIAKIVSMPRQTVDSIIQKFKKTGVSKKSRKQGGRVRYKNAISES